MRTVSTMILNVVIIGTIIGCVVVQAQVTINKPVRPATVQQPPNPNIMRVQGVSNSQPKHQLIQIQDKPAPLTATEKSALTGLAITNLIANAPFTLTPAAPIVTYRGALLFDNPVIVNPQNNPSSVALFKSQDSFYDPTFLAFGNRALTVVIDHLKAGKHYLIDCTVKGGETYYMRVMPGDLKQTFSGTSHVVILYEAGTDYGEFTITAKTSTHWFFYSAEVTPLD